MNYRQKKKLRKQAVNNTAKRRRYNKWLCKRYPFLIPRNVFSDEICWDKKYSWTLSEEFPKGWWKAFGLQFCEELREDLIKCNYLNKLRFDQIKEKYGQLRVYTNGIPIGSQVYEIIEHYSVLSENICIICGKPNTPMIDTGWISPECYECFCRRCKSQDKWLAKRHPEQKLRTDEEIRRLYDQSICE